MRSLMSSFGMADGQVMGGDVITVFQITLPQSSAGISVWLQGACQIFEHACSCSMSARRSAISFLTMSMTTWRPRRTVSRPLSGKQRPTSLMRGAANGNSTRNAAYMLKEKAAQTERHLNICAHAGKDGRPQTGKV